MKKPFLIAFVLIFFSSKFVNAANTDIVINEVLPNPDGSDDNEFIELYNKGSETVTITGWKLSDTVGSIHTYIIPENSIPAGGYLTFKKSETGITLNNEEGDGVVLKDDLDQQINAMSYNNTSISGRSWSRTPNGTGDFANNTQPTENSANSAPPTPTSVPTSTPKPENTSTPTPKPTNTPTPVPVNNSTPTPTKKPTPTPTKDPDLAAKEATMQAQVLQTAANAPQQDVEGESVNLGGNLSDLDKKKTSYNWSKLLILMGAVLVTCACGILVYNNYLKDKLEEMRSPQA